MGKKCFLVLMVLCGLCINYFLFHWYHQSLFNHQHHSLMSGTHLSQHLGNGFPLDAVGSSPLLKPQNWDWEDTQLFSRITFDPAKSTLTNAFLHLMWVLSKAIALILPSPVHSFPSPCPVFLYRGPSWKRHVSTFVNLLPFVFLMSDPGVLFQGELVRLSPW